MGSFATQHDISNLFQTVHSKYRGAGDDYYEDDEEEGGVDAIDSFLKNLPEILVSVIVIMIAYFVWSFFNSPTGSALGEAAGELVGMIAEMMQKWQLFLFAYVLMALIPAVGRGIAYVADRVDKGRTARSLQKYTRAQHDDAMALKRAELLSELNEKRSKFYIDAAQKFGYSGAQAHAIYERILAHEFVTLDDDGNPKYIPLPGDLEGASVSEGAFKCRKVVHEMSVATAESYERNGQSAFHSEGHLTGMSDMYKLAVYTRENPSKTTILSGDMKFVDDTAANEMLKHVNLLNDLFENSDPKLDTQQLNDYNRNVAWDLQKEYTLAEVQAQRDAVYKNVLQQHFKVEVDGMNPSQIQNELRKKAGKR